MKYLAQLLVVGMLVSPVVTAPAAALTAADYPTAKIQSGAELGELCAAKPDGGLGTASINLCHGYARGAVAAFQQLQAGSRHPLKIFCLPPSGSVSATEVLQEFAAWVRAKPAQAKERAVDALFAFLGIKFPCGK